MRVILLDTSNLFFCINRAFENRRLDYKAYLDYFDREKILAQIAYGFNSNAKINNFVSALKGLGYQTKFVNPPANFEKASNSPILSVDAMIWAPKITNLVIGSTDPSLAPVVEHLKTLGVNVTVFACGIPNELRRVSNSCVEITEDFLEAA